MLRVAIIAAAALVAALAISSSALATPSSVRMQTVKVTMTPPIVQFNFDPIVWDDGTFVRWLEWSIFDWTQLTLREWDMNLNCCHTYPTETYAYVNADHAYVYTVRACDAEYYGSPVACSAYESGTFQTYETHTSPLPLNTAIRWTAEAPLRSISSALPYAVGVYVGSTGATKVLLSK